MKIGIFLTVLGLSTGVVSSHCQGFVLFSSYNANNGNGALTRLFPGNFLLPVGYTATLYYAFGTISDPFNNGSIFPTGLTQLSISAAYDNSGAATGPAGLGYFDGGIAIIPGYTGGPITFEVVAYNENSSVLGRSGSFTMDGIATGALPVPAFGDNGQPMPNFFITIIPEPGTLTLIGLGGLISLFAFQRKP